MRLWVHCPQPSDTVYNNHMDKNFFVWPVNQVVMNTSLCWLAGIVVKVGRPWITNWADSGDHEGAIEIYWLVLNFPMMAPESTRRLSSLWCGAWPFVVVWRQLCVEQRFSSRCHHTVVRQRYRRKGSLLVGFSGGVSNFFLKANTAKLLFWGQMWLLVRRCGQTVASYPGSSISGGAWVRG